MITRCLVEPVDLKVYVPVDLADMLADVVSRILEYDSRTGYSLPDDLISDALDALSSYSCTNIEVCAAIRATKRSISHEGLMSVEVEL